MWRSTTLLNTIAKDHDKSKLECLQILTDRLRYIQQGLSDKYQLEYRLRNQVINTCQGIKICNFSLYESAGTFEEVCSELRSSIATCEKPKSKIRLLNYRILTMITTGPNKRTKLVGCLND